MWFAYFSMHTPKANILIGFFSFQYGHHTVMQKWNFPPHKDYFHVALMPHCLHNRPFPAL